MQYIYAAMLLHANKQEINEAGIESILKSAKVEYDAAKVKAMVASLKNINIDDAIAKAAVAAAAPAASAGAASAVEEKKEEENSAKKEEEAAAGLGALFG
jgi:large subunit ribosomal protein L12